MDDERDEALPSGWAWARLGSLGRWFGGGTPSKARPEFWHAGTIPWVSPKDMKAERVGRKAERITKAAVRNSATKIVPRGSVLCVMRSGILQHTFPTAISDTYVSLNQDMRALAPFPGVNPRYVQQYLLYRNSAVLATCAKDGTTVASVDSDKLASLIVPLAPAGEQDRIVAALDNLFTQLDEAEAAVGRARERARAYRASLLHAACTGALTADWRAANPNPREDGPALLRRILVERRAAWEREEEATLRARGRVPRNDDWKKRYPEPRQVNTASLPDLPKGWTYASLNQLITQGPMNGYSPPKSADGSGTLSLKLTATTQGWMDLSDRTVKRLSETIDPTSRLFLRNDDLLFQRGNTPEYVGIAAVFGGPAETYIFPDLMIRVRTGCQQLTQWLWRMANAPGGRHHMRSNADGTAGSMPKINAETLRNLLIPLPPLQELATALDIIADCESMMQEQEGALRQDQSVDLRQSILHAAFTGQLVLQDPADEPAAALLSRVRAGAAGAPNRRARLPRQRATA